MIRNILLSLLVLLAVTQTVYAAEPQTFNERKANLAEFHAIRVGYGLGTVRIVLDLTRKVEIKESYVENPSRMIVDLQNTWLNPTVQREIELKSTVGKRIRIAQFDPSTVRLVIESMAETKLFFLPGGKSGQRLIIDLGSAEFKEEPELNKSDADRERELQAQRERELAEREQAQRERELQAQREKELQAQQQREKELEERERELAKREQAQRERELQAQREKELQAQQKREKELEERERELAKREQAQREKELKEQREREVKEQRERDRERLEQEKREKKERERLEKEQREREKKERKERERLEKQREREKKERKDTDKDNEREVDKPFTELDNDLQSLMTLKGKIIVIDPGHGGNDAGAIGPTGVMEKNVTLRVSLELRKLLEAEGAQVILTRYDDSTVSAKGAKASDIEELGARCDVANRAGADIFISIHADSFTRPEARGTTGYYYSKSTTGRGQKLADCIRRNLVEQLGTPSRGTQPCNFYVVKNTDMPATLIELGFISNKDEEKLLDSDDGVKRAAQGIFDGIEDYFG